MERIKYQYFSKEAVDAGELTEFVNLLMKQSYGKSDYYNDIHIRPEDCGAFVVEWCQNSWNNEVIEGRFEAVDYSDDEEVGKWLNLPDGNRMFVPSIDQEESYNDWLKEHPEYIKEN